jgi:surface protein
MKELFKDYHNFNESLEFWDVSKVKDMSSMFEGCTHFNQPLTNWNVSRVKDMSNMFKGCTHFNHPLNTETVKALMPNYKLTAKTDPAMFSAMEKSEVQMYEDIKYWDVSKVKDMSNMFEGCTHFNQPLTNWNVFRVQDMSSMFKDCRHFNEPLTNWNVSRVEDMSSMFDGCTDFNQPLTSWNMSRVKDMSNMFVESGMNKKNLSDIGYNNVGNLQALLKRNIKKNKYGTPVKNAHKHIVKPFIEQKYSSSTTENAIEDIEKAKNDYNEFYEKKRKEYKEAKKKEEVTTKKRNRGKKIEPATTKQSKHTYFDDEGNPIPEKDASKKANKKANKNVTIGGKKRRNKTCKR